MDAERIESMDSHTETVEPTEDSQANPTTRIKNPKQEISLGLLHVQMGRSIRKPTKRLKSEIIGQKRSLTMAL